MTDPQNPAGDTPAAPEPTAATPAPEAAAPAPETAAPAAPVADAPPSYEPAAPVADAPPSYEPAAPVADAPPAAPAAEQPYAAQPYSAQPYAAAPPAPYGPPAGTTVPGKTLGIVALVVVFFFSLVGLILGYVAKSQSKKAGVPNTPATVAIILGWVFLVLSIIATIIIIVVIAAGAGAYAEFCQELGSGVWELENGTTITCQ
jgi:hypothetical protein